VLDCFTTPLTRATTAMFCGSKPVAIAGPTGQNVSKPFPIVSAPFVMNGLTFSRVYDRGVRSDDSAGWLHEYQRNLGHWHIRFLSVF
jgi:hypothetical protein